MTAPVIDTTTTWTIDPAHSLAEFSVKHMMISTVKGRFGEVSGTVLLDEEDITRSTIEAEIEAASIDTRQAQRDAHLRSGDFFDVERWPRISFRSRAVERDGDDLRVTGDLTIRDVTREVVLRVADLGRGVNPYGVSVAGYSATTAIDRTDFGLTWNQALETGGVLVSNQVKITLEIQLAKQ